MRVERLTDGPIVGPSELIGQNINGPSLMRVPAWVENPIGRYYLYFAHHSGKYIRMAYADELAGPWRIYEPGVLGLEASGFVGHVASPDVHIEEGSRQIRMYVHGLAKPEDQPAKPENEHPMFRVQRTKVVVSKDGLTFAGRTGGTGGTGGQIGPPYLRPFEYDGMWYAVSQAGVVSRSADGWGTFEPGPVIFNPGADWMRLEADLFAPGAPRHVAVVRRGEVLDVYFSRYLDCPEHIVAGRVLLSKDWRKWRCSAVRSVLKPERAWEGADKPLVPSRTAAARGPVHQLRDPGLFEEDGRLYVLYSVAGESGLGIAQIWEEAGDWT